MNNVKLKLGALAVIAGLYSAGASAETAPGEATANVITPLTITAVQIMDFGDISGGTNGGTLTMADGGGITEGGDAIQIGALNTGTPLGFSITGENLYSVVISINNITPPPVLSNGLGGTMALAMNTVPDLATTGVAIPITVGGILTVNLGQAGGAYSTDTAGGQPVVITANYQ